MEPPGAPLLCCAQGRLTVLLKEVQEARSDLHRINSFNEVMNTRGEWRGIRSVSLCVCVCVEVRVCACERQTVCL